MEFKIETIRKLYKEYYRLHIFTDNPKNNMYIDIEINEFINLFLQMKECVEMDSLDILEV